VVDRLLPLLCGVRLVVADVVDVDAEVV